MAQHEDNPPNPYLATRVEYLEEAPEQRLEIYEEEARSIVSHNQSDDLPFAHSVNPYRGCIHACAYCYARPTHQYLGFGAGTDFDRKIVVKRNAPQLLRAHFLKASWQGDAVMFSGVTDCYQPIEHRYRLTRQCLEVCAEFHNPVMIVTKGALVARDVDVLKTLSERAMTSVCFSLATTHEDTLKTLEPWASSAARRLDAMKTLSLAGVRTGVLVSPIIPGLTDSEVVRVLEAARDHGARDAFMTLLRLPGEVAEVFSARVTTAWPERGPKLLRLLTESRDGAVDQRRFGDRMKGEGPRWEITRQLFVNARERLGFERERPWHEAPRTFRRPVVQGSLF